MSLQAIANEFNKRYIKATRTSDPVDYGDAVMVARHLVLELNKEGVIADNYAEEFFEQEGGVL